jgi:hypothetical protein
VWCFPQISLSTPSVSGFKYYLVILDHCSHFIWTFPLRLKSDTFPTLSNFFAHVATQFGCPIKSVQCDNGREFDNSASRAFFLAKGVSLRLSCPYTSQQNGKAERMLRTLNNITRTLLFQASMPPPYWADALATATHLSNRLPTKTLNMSTPFFAPYGVLPYYHDLRAFGCTCYTPTSPPQPHKLAPHSTLCAFLGFSPDHKGYRCLDLSTNRVIISRHVIFDETSFPFSLKPNSPPSSTLDFLTDDAPIQVFYPSAGSSGAPGPHLSSTCGPPPGFPARRPITGPGNGASRPPSPGQGTPTPRPHPPGGSALVSPTATSTLPPQLPSAPLGPQANPTPTPVPDASPAISPAPVQPGPPPPPPAAPTTPLLAPAATCPAPPVLRVYSRRAPAPTPTAP